MATTYQYLVDPNLQFQNLAGTNNVAGFLRVFYNGTDDRAVTYSDFDGTANPSDIPLDNNGRAVVIADVTKVYRLEVYNRVGALQWSQYPLITMGGGPLYVEALTSVSHDSSMTGDGTSSDPLCVASSIVSGASAGATAVQPGDLSGYLTSVSHDSTMTGSGTAGDPLSVAAGTNLNVASGVLNVNNASCTTEDTTSVALGRYTVAKGTGQVVVGKYNSPSISDLFQIGNGTAGNRKNSMSVNNSGDIFVDSATYFNPWSNLIVRSGYYYTDLLAPARNGFTRLAEWKNKGTESNVHELNIRIDDSSNTFSHIISSNEFKIVWISGNFAVKFLDGYGNTTNSFNLLALDLGGGAFQGISPVFPSVNIVNDTWINNSVSAPFFLANPYTYASTPLFVHFGKSANIAGQETDISYSYSFVMWGIL